MAEIENYTEQAMDDHQKTYARFLSVTKYALALIAIILIAMAVFLA